MKQLPLFYELSGSAKDLTGLRFGKLTAILPLSGCSKTRGVIWRCKCDCGRTKDALSRNLIHGGTRSCGCLLGNTDSSFTGASNHPLYNTWKGMKARCYNPGATGYVRYGGRGITVCSRWKNNFQNFIEDMGIKPHDFTLDRIDPDKGYYPRNCRWASRKLQSRCNRSKEK